LHPPFGDADAALLALLQRLQRQDYRFVTPTPETHRRVLKHAPAGPPGDLREIFGWNRAFDRASLDPSLLELLERAGMVEPCDPRCKSLVRVSSIGTRLFLHSPYPTDAPDSVFLGPDSYRFAAFLERELPRAGGARRLVDIGAGAGVGAIVAAPFLPSARLTLLEINPLALRFARINAAHAGVEVEAVEGAAIDDVSGAIDLVIANPPFIVDPAGRAYRDGGSLHGAHLSLDWALAAARRIAPGGRILLYTGSAIVAGRDGLFEALARALPELDCTLRYAEIDPDIFGEQLDEPGYEDVERIAAVGAVIGKAAPG
jgi:hypothetical protein